MASSLRVHAKVLLVLLQPLGCWAASDACANDKGCQAHVKSLVDELGSVGTDMQGKRKTIESLDRFRRNVASGVRIELPPTQREYLQRGSKSVGEVSFDTKHRPISTNKTRHVHRSKLVGNGTEVCLHALMPIKPKTLSSKSGPFTLLITISVDGRMSIFSATSGDMLVDSMDLGHPAGVRIRHLVASRGSTAHYILTADSHGQMRVHNIKVVAKKAESNKWKAAPSPASQKARTAVNGTEDNTTALETETAVDVEESQNETQELATRMSDRKITISANFSSSFKMPVDSSGHRLWLKAVLPVERDDGIYFVAGDSIGGLTVFHDGKIKGRTKVTDDAGGIRGLTHGQAQQVVFFSSHSFGFFSAGKVDVPFAPCRGWTAPLVNMVMDPNHGYTKAILALADGDVLVFSTMKDKVRVCELTHKFPRVSQLPFKLQMWKWHAVGIQLPPPEAPKVPGQTSTPPPADHLRELFFFNTQALDAVHGEVASRIVTAQLNFRPRRLDDFAINGVSGMAPGDRSRAQLAIRFAGETGVEVSELTLKQPPSPKSGNTDSEGAFGWFSQFPKIAIFAVVVLGVVLWNVRKARFNRSKENAASAFDEDSIKETIKEAKASCDIGKDEDEDEEEVEPKIEEIYD